MPPVRARRAVPLAKSNSNLSTAFLFSHRQYVYKPSHRVVVAALFLDRVFSRRLRVGEMRFVISFREAIP